MPFPYAQNAATSYDNAPPAAAAAQSQNYAAPAGPEAGTAYEPDYSQPYAPEAGGYEPAAPFPEEDEPPF